MTTLEIYFDYGKKIYYDFISKYLHIDYANSFKNKMNHIQSTLNQRKSKLALKIIFKRQILRDENIYEVLIIPLNILQNKNHLISIHHISDFLIMFYYLPEEYRIQDHSSITEIITFSKYFKNNDLNEKLKNSYFNDLNYLEIQEKGYLIQFLNIFHESLNSIFVAYYNPKKNNENTLMLNLNHPKLNYDNLKPIIIEK